MIQLIALCLGTLFSNTAHAATLPLITVTSSYPDGYTGVISVNVSDDDSSVTGFKFEDNQGSTLSYTPDQVRKGAVLLHALDKDIIKMVSPTLDEKSGGEIWIHFLRNFFGSDVRKIAFDFLRDPAVSQVQGNWAIVTNDTQGRETFDGLQVRIKSSLGVPSAVDRVYLKRGNKTVRDINPTDLPHAKKREWLLIAN